MRENYKATDICQAGKHYP